MTMAMVDQSLILSHRDFYGDDMGEFESQRRWIVEWKSLASGYVWGRLDTGDKTGYSEDFANAYALANVVTGGYTGPVQGAFHEWEATGRILVKLTTQRIASVHVETDEHNTQVVVCRPVPWAGYPHLRWWDNKPTARKVCLVKHNV